MPSVGSEYRQTLSALKDRLVGTGSGSVTSAVQAPTVNRIVSARVVRRLFIAAPGRGGVAVDTTSAASSKTPVAATREATNQDVTFGSLRTKLRNTPRLVLALHSDRLFREQLGAAARRHGFELQFVDDWSSLEERVRTAPASALVAVDPYAEVAGRKEPSVNLAALLNRYPSVSVTAALTAEPGRLEHVRRLGAWGVVQVIDLQEELSSIAIGERLLSTRGQPLRNLIDRALPATTSGAARSILATAAQVASQGGQGRDLAEAFHVTLRTLTRWCRRAGIPPARPLLTWMRVLLAAELLDDPGRTVTNAALSCGYASESSLRHALSRYAGLSTTTLREQGAFATVSEAFLRALAEARKANKRYRAPVIR